MSQILRIRVRDWCNFILQPPNRPLLFLDTETTGLGSTDEIIDISIVDIHGVSILDTLIKPSIQISREATQVHNITNQMITNAPTWDKVWPFINQTMGNNYIGIYNAEFDVKMIEQTSKKGQGS